MAQEQKRKKKKTIKKKKKKNNKKTTRRSKETFLQRRHTNDQKAHEKMVNIANYYRNANQNCNETSPHTSQNDHH